MVPAVSAGVVGTVASPRRAPVIEVFALPPFSSVVVWAPILHPHPANRSTPPESCHTRSALAEGLMLSFIASRAASTHSDRGLS